MVNSSKKNATDEFASPAWGEPSIQRWDAKQDKPTVFTCSKDLKARDFLS